MSTNIKNTFSNNVTIMEKRTCSHRNTCEYDKQYPNNNKLNISDRGYLMKQEDFRRLERKQNDMNVTLEFPKEPEKEENIKREVKGILSNILQEHITKIS
jgi:hypothetical protein